MPEATAGPVVHAFKYDGWFALAPDLAARMARLPWPADVVAERTALVAVPLARTRERERGYNQSELLAASLAAHWRLPLLRGALERARRTRAQARLTPEERLHNVAGAFRVVAPSAELRGRHLILVDDVVTTAATLNACAAALFDGGTRAVSYVTFGRARSPGDVST
jgi:ComF family protein